MAVSLVREVAKINHRTVFQAQTLIVVVNLVKPLVVLFVPLESLTLLFTLEDTVVVSNDKNLVPIKALKNVVPTLGRTKG
jgi:hypothetical protein